MAATYIFNHRNGINDAWLWEDADDESLVAWFTGRKHRANGDFSVDRSSGSAVLRWQYYTFNPGYGTYSPSGTYGELPLFAGDYIRAQVAVYPNSAHPAIWDMTNFWRVDYYGRPYDINDLIAM